MTLTRLDHMKAVLVHINRDIKGRQNKDKDSTVHTTEKMEQKKSKGGSDLNCKSKLYMGLIARNPDFVA